jgi:hypothetical protein
MLLAELTVRHTRRHMPTRRVALESAYIPTSGPRHGLALLGAVVEEFLPALAEEQLDPYVRLVDESRAGLLVPSIAVRHRLQTDLHGLDRSRHRLIGEAGRIVIELDVHGAPIPQLLGAVLAVAQLPLTARGVAARSLREVIDGRRTVADDVEIRRQTHWHPGVRPPLAGVRWQPADLPGEREWRGVPADQRWAMEVLGMRATTVVTRGEVNRRYRRLLRDAHPDHGGAGDAAAERIAELAEARSLLLATVDVVGAQAASSEHS